MNSLMLLLAAVSVVEPKATDEALINPGMGFVHYAYSSRIWAYDTKLEPGDTLDWIPGTSVVYMRLPWSYLEPEEGKYRWDILDVKARPWIEKGKKLAFRFAVMDHTLNSIPDWAMKAGIKGAWYPYRFRKGAAEWFEPEWDDPILLEKYEAFLRAFAARWDGNPDVAFVDVGSFGAYGEGHGPSINKLRTANNTAEIDRLAKIHLDLARRCLPKTYLVVSDDIGGSRNQDPNCPIMAYARKLGIGFRDDSIFCVEPPQCWAHTGWARQFAKTLPVVVETGHHVRLDKAGGGDFAIEKWFPEKIFRNLVEYQASYYTVQSFPKHLWKTHAHLWKDLAKRLGYRLELRKVSFPDTVKAGEPVKIASTWVNVGVAPLYAGASLTWNLLNEKGVVVWSFTDDRFDFKTLAPTLEEGEKPREVVSCGNFGYTTPVPDNGNDDVLKWAQNHPEFDPGKTIDLLKPGVYTLAVSVGRKDGKPTIALPLAGDAKRRLYPLGSVTVKPAVEVAEQTRTVRREADGLARMTFTFRSPVVSTFDVEVNGAWAGSVAVPPLSPKEGVSVPFDAPFKKGTNTVRIYAERLPEIIGFSVGTPAKTPGLETEKWQKLIDAAAQAATADGEGGSPRRVTIPAGRHVVGGLELRSNVELHLEKGAVLEGAYGLQNYRIWSLPCSEGTWSAIVAGVGVTNVAITGEGEIYGNGRAWPMPKFSNGNQEGQRARGIFLADAKDVRLEDFLLRDAACWGIVLKCVDGLVARRVRIDNHSNYNNDGFDIEVRNAVFDGCDVDSSDDAFVFKSNNPKFVVENVLVTNSTARSHCNAYKFGTATHGTMRHVKFVDSKALPPRRDFILGDDTGPDHGIKGKGHWSRHMGYDRYPAGCGIASLVVECVDGGTVEDILFENMEISGATVPIFVRGGTRKGRHNGVPPGNQYRLRDITFRNIRGEAAGWIASSVTGVKGCRAENITLENIDIRCHGAGEAKSLEALRKPVPDVSGNYPEATMFRHILPAFGLYVDQTDNLTLKNVTFRLFDGETDRRPPISPDAEVLPLVPYPQKVTQLVGRVTPTGTVFRTESSLPAEGYRLRIADRTVEIASSTEAGRFYAQQTLGQLKGADGSYPSVEIEDAPAFPWRGVLLDVSRHFWGKDVVKRVLDRMAAFKLNVFHWHLTDSHGWRLQIDRYPELTDRGARRPIPDWDFNIRDAKDAVGEYGPFFYTKEDVREILDYAKARHIRVIPEIEIPGHSRELILCHPEFSCLDWGTFADKIRTRFDVDKAAALCVGNEDAMKFLENVLDEVADLFPDEIVHIGGDECPRDNWASCPKCQKRMRDEGLKSEDELQSWVTRRFSKYLAKKGKRIIGWDEILQGGLPAGAIVMSWRGAAGGIAAAAQGHDAVVCPHQLCYLDYPTGAPDDTCAYPRFCSTARLTLEKVYSFDPYAGIPESQWKHVLGSQTLNWGESTWDERDLAFKMWPRTCANAEIVWTGPNKRTFADFKSRLDRQK